MKHFKKTAIAMGVAQIALLSSSAVMAQDAAAPKDGASTVVVVTGQRAALQSAQKIKQNADEIVDSIVADDIGKLPDRSVTEVLQRIVGVTMDRTMAGDPQHYAVEGSGIAIRGLTYVRSELNGRDSFSANGGRSLSFEDVPPELMAGVDVYKNPSAEQTEGAISGLVNLRTKLPFDSKGFKAAATVEASYSHLGKDGTTPSYSVLLSDRWKTPIGEFGALIDFAHSESNTRTDAFQVDPLYPRTDIQPGKTLWVPKGALWRTTEFERERQGKYAAFQWRPSANLNTSLTWFRSDYQMTWSEQALLMQHATPYAIKVADGKFNDLGAFQSGILSDPANGGINLNPDRRVADRQSQTTDLAFNADWRVASDWRLKVDVQKIKAKTKGFDSDVATGLQMKKQNLDISGGFPVMKFDDEDRAQMADAKNYYWAYTMEHQDRGTADSKALRLDLEHSFDHPVLRDIRFGARMTDRNARTQNTNPSYNWQGVTQPWMVGWRIPNLASLGDPRFGGETRLHEFKNFFGGDVNVPSVVFPNDVLARGYPGTYETLHSYSKLLCEQLNGVGSGTCPTWRGATFGNSPAEINNVNEKTKAFFTQLRFGFDDLKYPIDGNIGIRYVKTDTVADGFTVYTPSAFTIPPGGSVTGVRVPDIPAFEKAQSYDNTYTNWLPSLNLKLKASDTLQFRLAIGSALTRPNFSQMQGYTTLTRTIASTTNDATKVVNIENVSLTGEARGNPMLKPTTSRQIDLTAEWYPAPGKSLTLAVFNKQLKDIVVNSMSTLALTDRSGQSNNFLISTPTNGAKGTARGFEVAGQMYFDNLPQWASGLGVQGSFTFVDSKRKLYSPVNNAWCSGTGDGAANLDLFVNGCDTNGQTFTDLPLEGLSRRTINFALLYDKGPVSARLAYNWRSRAMIQVAAWGVRQSDGRDYNPQSANPLGPLYYGLPLWADDYGQLDAGFSYKFNDKFSIGIDAQNLTDRIYKQDMQQHAGMIGHAWFATGPRYSAKLNVNF